MTELTAPADPASHLMALLRAGHLAAMRLGGRTLLPIVQGGMGVGVSAHRLAGTVASLGGMGTI
jgi:nitronate monooxygenase